LSTVDGVVVDDLHLELRRRVPAHTGVFTSLPSCSQLELLAAALVRARELDFTRHALVVDRGDTARTNAGEFCDR